jgi:hypothetical protein
LRGLCAQPAGKHWDDRLSGGWLRTAPRQHAGAPGM